MKMTTKKELKDFEEALDWGINTFTKILEVGYLPIVTCLEIDEKQAAYLDIIQATLRFIKDWKKENEHQTNGN